MLPHKRLCIDEEKDTKHWNLEEKNSKRVFASSLETVY